MSTLTHADKGVKTAELPNSATRVAAQVRLDSFAYELVAGAVSLVLLASAVLKFRQLSSPEHIGVFSETFRSIVVIIVQWAVAIWLISGIAKARARKGTIALFVLMLFIALYRMIKGAPDCGCFGEIRVPPSVTGTFDFLAILALLALTPVPRFGRSAKPRPVLRPVRLLAVFLLAAALPAIAMGTRLDHIQSAAVPELACDADTFDFGSVPAWSASSMSHEFTLRNISDRNIHITKTFSSCGCTVTPLHAATIGPGQRIVIPVKVDWSTRDGPQRSMVTLVTDSAADPMTRLTLVGTVQNSVLIWPRAIDFGEVAPGSSAEQTVTVSPQRADAPFTIHRVESTNPAFKVRRVSRANASALPDAATFALHLSASRQARTYTGRVLFFTSADPQPFIVIVNARSSGAITAAPASLVVQAGGIAAPDLQIRVRVANPAPGSELSATLVGGPQPTPFKVRVVTTDVRSDGLLGYVGVALSKGPAVPLSCRIHISCGEDALDVPVAYSPAP